MYNIINLAMLIWDYIYSLLNMSSVLVVRLMNFVCLPNKNSGKVSAWRLLLWFSANIALIYILVILDNIGFEVKFFAAVLIMILHILIVIARMVMMEEENLVMEGIIHRDKMQFSKFQASIPNAALYISSVLIFISLSLAIQCFDRIFHILSHANENLDFIDYNIFIVNQIILWAYENLTYTISIFSSYSTFFVALTKFFLYTIFWLFLYSVVILNIKQVRAINSLIDGLKSKDSDIFYLQQKAARCPGFIKTKLINLAIESPDKVVRRRAISIMPHAKVASFPGVYIFNLHKEEDEEIKLWGMKKVLDILNSSEIKYEEDIVNKIVKSIQYQLRKKHSEKIIQLLVDAKKTLLNQIKR
ncbi:hypothetical protein TI04_07920 [Achromatium sp. WMS2]|nr:hypothetical protein TI04_07920 [Achromatium sp. WMS2]